MDRRTRISLAAGMALALAGCSSTASPSQPATSSPSASRAVTLGRPTVAPSPTQITGLPFTGTLAFKRDVVDGPHLLFTMPASGGDGVQLLDGDDAEQARWSADGSRLSVVVESPQGLIFVGFVDRDGTNVVRFDSPDPTLNLGCGGWSRDESTFVCEGWDEQKPDRAGCTRAVSEAIARTTRRDGG